MNQDTTMDRQEAARRFADIRIDDEVSFAHYYQPGQKLQFAYKIEWIAVKETGNAVLLLSRKGLYCKHLDKNNASSWEDSSLRAWLNGEFLKKSFEHGTEVMLLPVNCDDPMQITPELPYQLPKQNGFRGKRADQDYVFLLGQDDLRMLYPGDCFASAHWIADESQVETPHAVSWWLRPDSEREGKCVNDDGEVVSCACNAENVFVRPAIWIDNYYLKAFIYDVTSRWEKLIAEAENNCFDYEFFKKTASQTYDVIYFYRNALHSDADRGDYLKDLFERILQYSHMDLQNETDQHRLAKNAAESFYLQRTHWFTIYKYKPKPGEPGALTHALIMPGLDGESIVVNTRDFDMEHPLDKEQLAQEGYYTL